MELRRSQLHEAPRRRSEKTYRWLGRIARTLTGTPENDGYAPVNPDVLELSRFINARTNPARLSKITAVRVRPPQALDQYRRSDIKEYPIERGQFTARPTPNFIFTVRGNNYRRTVPNNSFMCQFSVFNLGMGNRLIQATPYGREYPLGVQETYSQRQTLKELFDSAPQLANEMRDVSCITLGVLGRDGQLTLSRPFNTHAFDCDLIPILDRISSPDQTEPLNIEISGGYVTEYV